jgi:hypothetical protein
VSADTATDAGDPDAWPDTPRGEEPVIVRLGPWSVDMLPTLDGETLWPGVHERCPVEGMHTHTEGGLRRLYGTPGGVSTYTGPLIPVSREALEVGGVSTPGGAVVHTEGGSAHEGGVSSEGGLDRWWGVPDEGGPTEQGALDIGALARGVVEQGLGVQWVALPDSVQQQLHRVLEAAATYRAPTPTPTHPPTPTPGPVAEVVGARMGDPCTRCPHVMVMHTRDGCQASRCECKVTKR